MARKLRGDRILSHVPADWAEIGPWQIMICGPARCGGSWIWGALRMIAGATGRTPCPENGEVDDLRIRNLIGSAWIEQDRQRSWILRTHVDWTSLLYGWRIVVVHRDPREVACSIVEGAGAPFEVAMAHLDQTTHLVDSAARLAGSPVLTVPWHLMVDDPRAVLRALAAFVKVDPDTLDLTVLLQRLGHPEDAERLERAGGADLAAMPAILPPTEGGVRASEEEHGSVPALFSFGFLDVAPGPSDDHVLQPVPPFAFGDAVPTGHALTTVGSPRTAEPAGGVDTVHAGAADRRGTISEPAHREERTPGSCDPAVAEPAMIDPTAGALAPVDNATRSTPTGRASITDAQMRLLERRFANWLSRWGYDRGRRRQAA